MKPSGKKCARYGCRKSAKSKFCSSECRVRYHNDRRQPAEKVRIRCAGCEKDFLGRPDQKTCSNTCRSRLFRRHNAAQRAQSSIEMEWRASAPYSPTALRDRMSQQLMEQGVEYSWLPASRAKPVRVRRSQSNEDQLPLDFDAAES